MNTPDVARIKAAERRFRETDTPYGEHVAQTRSPWGIALELGAVFSALKPEIGMSIVDLGSSDGRFLGYLAMRRPGGFLVGTDFAISPLRRQHCAGLPTAPLAADLTDLPFRSNSFDQAVLMQVIQHVPTGVERRRSLEGVREILKSNGRVVVTVVNRSTWYDRVENGVEGALKSNPDIYLYLYTPADLRADLEAAGFSTVSVTGLSCLPGRTFNRLGIVGMFVDRFITRFLPWLALRKATYLLASCKKA